MALSFKEYMIISAAFQENQLDENKLVADVTAWLKKKFNKEPSKDEVEKAVGDLKANRGKTMDQIAKTKQSRDFHARRAEMAKKAATAQAAGTRPTIGTVGSASKLDGIPSGQLRAGQARAAERSWVGEDTLTEGMADFVVSYTTRLGGGNKTKRTIIRGRDARDVRRKFGDTFYGAKVLSVEPMKDRPQRQKMSEPEVIDEE